MYQHNKLLTGLAAIVISSLVWGNTAGGAILDTNNVTIAPPDQIESKVSQPLLAVFTVNSVVDNTTSDNFLTLREAMLIANGGTGNGGLGRRLTPLEKNQLSGCNTSVDLSGSYAITGGCGVGAGDSIKFAANITEINLTSVLPAITAANVSILGEDDVVIDAQSVAGNTFEVKANTSTISGLQIIASGSSSKSYSHIALTGKGHTISGNFIGVRKSSTSCTGFSTLRQGIYISVGNGSPQGSASTFAATMLNNVIGCNTTGISNNENYVSIGNTKVGNFIGSMPGGASVPNKGSGIALGDNGAGVGSQNIVILNNTIKNNVDGISMLSIAGPVTTGGTDVGNTIMSNTHNGLSIYQSSKVKVIENVIANNGYSGISNIIDPTATLLLNDWSKVSIYGNGRLGIDIQKVGEADATVTDPNIAISSATVVEEGSLDILRIAGTAPIPLVGAGRTVQVYEADPDPSSYGEGKKYLGEATVNSSGAWSFDFILNNNNKPTCITAFLTTSSLLGSNSSEFAKNLCPNYSGGPAPTFTSTPTSTPTPTPTPTGTVDPNNPTATPTLTSTPMPPAAGAMVPRIYVGLLTSP